MSTENAVGTLEDHPRGYARRMLLVISLGTMLMMTARMALSPLLPRIIDDLGVTTAEAGGALTLMWALVALAQYPGGVLSDELSRKTVLVAGLLLAAVGILALGTVGGFPLFLVAVAVLGFGSGLYEPGAFVHLTELFVERRGLAVGVNAAAFDVGGAASAGIAVVVLAVATWREAFAPLAVGVLLVAVALHLWNTESYVVEPTSFAVADTAKRMVATARLRRTVVAFSLYNLVWQGSISFLPTYLQVQKEVTPFLANNAFAGLFLIGVVVKPLAGRLGDRVGESTVAVWVLAVGVVGLAGLVAAESTGPILAGVAVFAVGLGAYFPVMTTYLMNSLALSSRGGDLGAARAVLFGVGSLGSTYVGVVAGSFDYEVAFGGFAVVLLTSTLLTLTLDGIDPADLAANESE